MIEEERGTPRKGEEYTEKEHGRPRERAMGKSDTAGRVIKFRQRRINESKTKQERVEEREEKEV